MSFLAAGLALVSIGSAQDTTRYTHADTLRGSNGPARAWWDVQFYDLHTRVNLQDSSIVGWNGITYRVLQTPWIATANEGLGASVWWPNKDYLADEPDSQRIAITVPDPLVDVSNGRLRSTTKNRDGTTTYEWFVTSPINNYDVTINAGHYAHFSDTLTGEAGRLTLDFWPLDYHVDTARRQFQQVTPLMRCFEHWFGPYPWYVDGYKLVETPHLGMEHQSAVAYGGTSSSCTRAPTSGSATTSRPRITPTCGCTRASRITLRGSTPSAAWGRAPARPT